MCALVILTAMATNALIVHARAAPVLDGPALWLLYLIALLLPSAVLRALQWRERRALARGASDVAGA